MYDFAHVGIVVSDAERSAEFYTRVLGCEITGRMQNEHIKFVNLKAGRQEIELLQYITPEGQRQTGPVDHIAFYVPDMEAAVANLKENQVTLLFEAPPDAGGGTKIMFFTGPDGERIEFIERAK